MNGYILLTVPTVLWGVQPIVLKLLLEDFNASAILLIRSLLMFFVYCILMRTGRSEWLPHMSLKKWILVVLMGVCGTTICGITQYEGLQYAPVFHCLIFSAAAPAITACMAVIFLKERMVLRQWLGVIFSGIGVLFILSEGQIGALVESGVNQGDLLFFLFEIAWSSYIVMGKHVMNDMTPLQTTFWSTAFGIITFIPYMVLARPAQIEAYNGSDVVFFLFVSIVTGAISMIFWNKGIAVVGANGAAFNNITPFVGSILGYLVLGERLSFMDIFGFFVVVFGIYLLLHQTKRKVFRFKKRKETGVV